MNHFLQGFQGSDGDSERKEIDSQKKEKKDSPQHTNSEEHIQTEEEEHFQFSIFIRENEGEFEKIEQEFFDEV